MSKIIYLKDYFKQKDGPLENKIVVGSDIRPAQAVNLAYNNRSLQVVTGGFDEQKVVKIKSQLKKFMKAPHEYIFGEDSSDKSFQQKFFKNSKKEDFLHQVSLFLKAKEFRKVREDIYLMADELFTNFAKSAGEDVKSMKFGIECCGGEVLVYCKDNFGHLKPQMMVENIYRCYENGVKNSIRHDVKGGAGIGSYLMYSLSSGMVLAVRPECESMVVMWMPLGEFHEDRVDMNKSLIIIEGEE